MITLKKSDLPARKSLTDEEIQTKITSRHACGFDFTFVFITKEQAAELGKNGFNVSESIVNPEEYLVKWGSAI